ncbi:heterokaryon incompatibility protein-domain-containing protein, partial [Ganoderma leucocontextum]
MRLIDTETGRFVECVDSTTAPLYAILSHTWDKREQSYQEVVKIQEAFGFSRSPPNHLRTPLAEPRRQTFSMHRNPSCLPNPHSPRPLEAQTHRPSPIRRSIWDPDSGLSEKVRKACEIARRDGYRYIWVDSSCIDKTSSSELSEAINSMFKWYRDAQICYALLSDVPSDEDVRAKDSKFRESRWFKRSWTLQELIAPRTVVFFSQDWKGLGTKDALVDLIEEITHIDRGVLTHKMALANESVGERMRWAAEREATRVEDVAYSLLGIFGITMPALYGEGEYAFRRLQEEILRRIPDRTLFAWGECVP